MKRSRFAGKIFLVPVLIILLFVSGAGPVSGAGGCTGCGWVWEDSCIPFERNNETMYNAELAASTSPVTANLTDPIPDYSNASWTEAFLGMEQRLRERYAFTSWKAVDWDALNATFFERIADAEARQDKAAYYRTLRQFLFSVPDAHVSMLSFDDYGAKYADIGGGYGLSVSELDSGQVIVSYVANGSAAEQAGIRAGDRVTAWNGRGIHEAIRITPWIWAATKPSTAEGILLQQQRFLTRAPVGTPASVEFVGWEETDLREVRLTAYDDGYDTLIKTSTFVGRQINDVGVAHPWSDIKPQISNDTVTSRTLPGGYTYIAIYGESYDVYQPFRSVMLAAIANKTPGMVIDLRYNGGGDDNIASCFAGWFVDRPVFYEYLTLYDPRTGSYPLVSASWTRPRPEAYSGPVAVLVSPYTMSSGEGPPMVFKKSGSDRQRIISWYGTNGAFGSNSLQAIMPLGMYLFFPDGASLDENESIQVDSDASLSGGVLPDIRVPITKDTVARSMAGEDVQLTYALQWLDQQTANGSAAFTGSPRTGTAPLDVTFSDLSTGQPIRWLYEFGDGTSSVSRNPVHTYQAPGEYTVSLTVLASFDGDLQTSTISKPLYVTVNPQSIPRTSANFTANHLHGHVPFRVRFSDLSTGNVLKYLYDFGDGTSSVSRNPEHTYLSAGNFTVRLMVVMNEAGNPVTRSAIKERYIRVTETPVP